MDRSTEELSDMEQRQKLVTFFLHDGHAKGAYGDPSSNDAFGIKEHLNDYLQNGWKVTNLSVLGGAGGRAHHGTGG